MGRLKVVVVLMAIGPHGVFAADAPPDSSRAQPSPAPRPAASNPASELLRTGTRLFNKGLVDAASKCLNAAHRQQKLLSESERIVLHDYMEEIEKYSRLLAVPKPDPAVVRSSRVAEGSRALHPGEKPAAGDAPGPNQADPANPKPNEQARPKAHPSAAELRAMPRPDRYATIDPKAAARWRLYAAREQIFLGNYDEAARIVAEVRALKIPWGFFDDSPDKVTALLESTRAKKPAKRPLPTVRPLGVKAAPDGAPKTPKDQ